MKPIRVLLSLLMVMAILLASPVSASAMGFEAETIYESIFVIYSGNSLGSGFALGTNCIITNAHVIADNSQISVLSYSGNEYKATVLGINESEDIAVLVVENGDFPYLTVADTSMMKTGDDIYAIGAPKGMAYTLTKGTVSAKERIVRNHSYIQIDAAINEGNSGGPLLNDNGQVLGMNTLKMSDSEGIGLAIPINRICDYLQSLDIELTENGNISNVIDLPQTTVDSSIPTEDENDQTDTYTDEKIPAITFIACAIAVISLSCNIVMAVMLIYQKKKNLTLQYDPKERTDFEIDIWE